MPENVLVIGGGGREHALSWKLAQSDLVEVVFVAPGNAGTENASGKMKNVGLAVTDQQGIVTFCKENTVSLVVVGPEDPLAAGLADVLNSQVISCFGPSAKAAQIEASKAFAKEFMERHNIPTAKYKAFTDCHEAEQHILNADYAALVVKASGLAAGKGVVVAETREQACQAAKNIMQEKSFGKAGDIVVIEELLTGEEVSVLGFSDGKTIVCMPPAQDHKRLLEGDKGSNTGGMGAYCPCPLVSKSDLEYIQTNIMQRTIDGMSKEGMPYIGVLYAGLMLTPDGPKVLEFNCRLGDPETQVLMPMLSSDLYPIVRACVNGSLTPDLVTSHTDRHAVAVVTVSKGYPGSYKKGLPITGLDGVEKNLEQIVFHAGTKQSGDQVVTSGGRVLAVVAMDTSLAAAAQRAHLGAALVRYEGRFFRRDIGHKALLGASRNLLTYKSSGVDIGAGDNLVTGIKPLAKATQRNGDCGDLGLFGGFFDVKAAGYVDPLLVSGTDGVGTKLKVAQDMDQHSTVGIDLVAMCVNDVLCHGAEPLFFLDYFACGALDVKVAHAVIAGITEGCKQAGCSLLGGETAEMPGMYAAGDYDLAGFVVGAVERSLRLPRLADIAPGDVVIGLPSSGIHSNGFSLVRKVAAKLGYSYSDSCPFSGSGTLGQALLTPTKIYVKSLLPVLKSGKVKAMAHITGGGLPGNLPRVLPPGCGARLDASCWEIQPVYGWIHGQGGVPVEEMAKTFNLGIGAALVVAKEDTEAVIKQIAASLENAYRIGEIVPSEELSEQVEITSLDNSLARCFVKSSRNSIIQRSNGPMKRKVAVLISGTGTNLQALIDHTQNPALRSQAKIVLVISNKPGVLGLQRAEKAGIPTKVISHKGYSSREEFDRAVHQCLEEAGVELVCLAGFMRILSGEFVRKWNGRLLNIHPSLLPSFKGANAHRMVLEAGVRLSGCSVHFVAEEVDAGAILLQESVPVFPGDTEETLAERVKVIEHKAFPQALEMVASGKALLGENGKIVWN